MSKKYMILSILLFLFFTASSNAQDVTPGIKLIKNEKYSEAKKYFLSIANGKTISKAYFYLGEIYLLEEKVDSARMYYVKGIESNKDFPLNYCGLVKLNILDGNSSEVEKNQSIAIDLGDEKHPEVYVFLSEGYAKIKSFDKAIDLLNKALKINKQFTAAFIGLGKVYFDKADGSEAVKNFQKAIDSDEKNPEAKTLKAKVYILINNYNGAISLLDEAIKNDSSYARAYYELAELYYTMKDYSKSAENYSKYMENSDVTMEKKKRLASILYLNKDYKNAIELSKELTKNNPENPFSVRILAYSFFRLDDFENSLTYFQKLFSIPSVEYLSTDYENYAELLTKTGNDSLAVVYLTKVVDLDSTRKDILTNMSILYFKNKKWDGVISTLERKNQLKAQEYFDLGKAYYFTQNYTKADSAFNILTMKVPELGIAYFWQARVKTNFDPESEAGLAKPYYDKFVSFASADTNKSKKELIEAYSYLGYYYYIKFEKSNAREDKSSSLENWMKVNALDPENAQAIAAINQLKKKN